MSKTNKISISLPEEVLQAVEKEREDSGESRSQFFRRAVEMLLCAKKEYELSQKYICAYKEMPETPEEIVRARHAASLILADEPWQ